MSGDAELTQAFCGTCNRTAYVREDADLACPVCSGPLITSSSESQAG